MPRRLIPDNFYVAQAHGYSANEDGVSGEYIWCSLSGVSVNLYRLNPTTRSDLTTPFYTFSGFNCAFVKCTPLGLYAVNFDSTTPDSTPGAVYYSADGGVSWTNVLNMDYGHYLLDNTNSGIAHCVNGTNKRDIFGEYNINSASATDDTPLNGVRLWQTTDGATWTKLVDLVADGGTAHYRHIHNVVQFETDGPIYICVGDQVPAVIEWDGVTPWPDDTNGIDPAVLATKSGFNILYGEQKYRLIDLVKINGWIYGTSDTSVSDTLANYDEIGIWRFREGLTDFTRVSQEIGMPRSCIITCNAIPNGLTITINGNVYTAVLTGTDVAARQFDVSGVNAADAAELQTCLSDATYGVIGVTATLNSNTVELVVDDPMYTNVVIDIDTSDSTKAVMDLQGKIGWVGFQDYNNEAVFCNYTHIEGLTDFGSDIYCGTGTDFKRVGKFLGQVDKAFQVSKFFKYGGKYFFSGKSWPAGKPGGTAATNCLVSYVYGDDFDEERPDIIHPVYWVASTGNDSYNGWYPDTILGGSNGPKATLEALMENSIITYGTNVVVMDSISGNEVIPAWDAKAVRPGETGIPVQLTGLGKSTSIVELGSGATGSNTISITADYHQIDVSNIWIKTAKSAFTIASSVGTQRNIYGRDAIIGQIDNTNATRTLYTQNKVYLRRCIVAAPVSATNTKIGLANYGENTEYHCDGCIFVGGYAGIKCNDYTIDVFDITNCIFVGYYLAGVWCSTLAVFTSYELTNLMGQSNEGGTTYLFRTQNAPTWTVTHCYSPENYLGGTITGINTDAINWISLPATGTLTDNSLLDLYPKIGLLRTSALIKSASAANITLDINHRPFLNTPGAYESLAVPNGNNSLTGVGI